MSYEIEEIAGRGVMMFKQPDFWEWIDRKTGRSEFSALSLSAKHEIFLQWKFGYSNPEANAALESTEKEMVHLINNLTPKEIEEQTAFNKEYFKLKIAFSNWASTVWAQIEGNQQAFDEKKKEFQAAGL